MSIAVVEAGVLPRPQIVEQRRRSERAVLPLEVAEGGRHRLGAGAGLRSHLTVIVTPSTPDGHSLATRGEATGA